MMQKRQSHNKSRNGCQNCKKKHVKCDEQGPPCANCIARETTTSCKYSSRPQSHLLSQDSSDATSTTSETCVPPPLNTQDDSRRVLELELMHRWTTSTYKSLCSTPEDFKWIQIDVPHWAFKHTYLLDGILALSALEMVVCEAQIGDDKSAYVRAAMEYYDRASTSFRRQFSESSISAENIHCIYMFSCLAWPINMAMPQAHPQQASALSRVVTLIDLSMGSATIAGIDFSSIMESPMSASIRTVIASVYDTTSPDPLNATTKAVLARLASVVEGAVPLADTSDSFNHAAFTLESYKKAIISLRACYVEEAKGSIRGFCMAFPSMAGESFAVAINKSDAVALFILMHWAVLVDRLKDECWWVMSVGRDLVKEISDTLLQEQPQLMTMPAYKENIAWARQQVELFEEK